MLSRLLILASIIIAFAQPYFGKNIDKKSNETFIYLDNSLSMTGQNSQGELFRSSFEELLSVNSNFKTRPITLITNDQVYQKYDFENSSVDFNYTSIKKNIKTLLLEINNISQKNDLPKNIILISDFQNNKIKDF